MIDKKWILVFTVWFITLFSTLGSLFFSEVMGLPPCQLCWYQRICMYPLVFIFLAGLFPFERSLLRYSFPLSVTGFLTAIYHNLLYYKILPKSASPCSQGISCTTVQLEWLGFITIPLLSLTAFSLILIGLTLLQRELKNEK